METCLSKRTPHSTPPNYVNCLRESKQYVLGTDLVATPINTFITYGFDTSMQGMEQYIMMYAPMVFFDKSYQSLLGYINRYNPKQKEKQQLNQLKQLYKQYFGLFLHESDKSEAFTRLLDLLDEAGDRWTEIETNMPFVIFNTLTKYCPDSDQCRKISELICAYSWVNYTDVVYKDFAKSGHPMERDRAEYMIRGKFSRIILDMMKGKTTGNEYEIFSQIGDALYLFSKMIFQHWISILDKYDSRKK